MIILSVATEIGMFYWGQTPDGWRGWTRRKDQAKTFASLEEAASAVKDLIQMQTLPGEEAVFDAA